MERHIGKVWESPKQRLFMPPSLWNQDMSHSQHIDAFTSQEAHPSIGCPQFLLEFHYIHVTELIELTLQPSPLPRGSWADIMWLKYPTL